MADAKHVAKLRSGVSSWNDWRKRYPKLRPNLSGTQLGAIELRGADLQNVDFNGADLHSAIFTEAGIYEATAQSQNQMHRAILRGANLSNADLHGVDLCLADLTRTELMHADLVGSDLKSARLREANVANANLTATDLRHADLHRANLHRTDLSLANLIGADLSGAVLVRSNLNGANLSGANLGDAKYFETILANVDLTDVHGLELSSHAGPSVIDHRTLECSDGLNAKFLRGIGLPESLIKAISGLPHQQSDYYSCFISYSHADKGFARKLHDRLQECGVRCWLDKEHMLPGDNIFDFIDTGIKKGEKFLICCSKSSLNSPWVDRELEKALKKEETAWRECGREIPFIIPIDLDGELMRWSSAKASTLTARLAGNFVGWETDNSKFDGELEKIISALRIEQDS